MLFYEDSYKRSKSLKLKSLKCVNPDVQNILIVINNENFLRVIPLRNPHISTHFDVLHT